MVNHSNLSDEAKCIKETIEATLAYDDEPVERIAKQHRYLNKASNGAIEEVITSLSKDNQYGSTLKEFMENGELNKVDFNIVKFDIVKAIKSEKDT